MSVSPTIIRMLLVQESGGQRQLAIPHFLFEITNTYFKFLAKKEIAPVRKILGNF